MCLVDWKSSSRPRPTLDDCYDFPLQAVAYAGAVNRDNHYPFKVHVHSVFFGLLRHCVRSSECMVGHDQTNSVHYTFHQELAWTQTDCFFMGPLCSDRVSSVCVHHVYCRHRQIRGCKVSGC